MSELNSVNLHLLTSSIFQVNPGAVEGLLLHPTDPELLLIGYARGLIVLWNTSGAGTAVKTFVANQQLEGLSWRGDKGEFVSVHNDGSYILWSQVSRIHTVRLDDSAFAW